MLVIVSGSSGVGKNTVINQVLSKNSKIKNLISCTTRKIRTGEIEDVSYHYLTKKEFLDRFEKGEFAEMEEIHGNYYGTLLEDLEKAVKDKNIIIKDLGVEGVQNLQAILGRENIITIFIDAPKEILRERLVNRGEKEIDLRLSRYDYEHTYLDNYNYVVQNIYLDKCVEDVLNILDLSKKKLNKNKKEVEYGQDRTFN